MMKKKLVTFLLFLLCFLGGVIFMYYYEKLSYYDNFRTSALKDNGMLNHINIVPDEKTALKIAKSVWFPIYGTKNLFGYSYKIELIDESFWAIRGVNRSHMYFGIASGGPYIDIDKKTGRILQVGHTAADPKWWSRDKFPMIN